MTLKSLELDYSKPKYKSFDEMYMQLALNMAKLSTCARVQVGSVLVIDERPLITGYNGSPKGHKHCIDVFEEKYQEFCKDELLADAVEDEIASFEEYMQLQNTKDEHGKFSRIHEIHAEVNIIAQAAYKGLSTKDGKLYVTCSPCNDCCKSILTAGIKEVVFKDLYDRETEGLEILASSDVLLRQIILNEKGEVERNLRWTQA